MNNPSMKSNHQIEYRWNDKKLLSNEVFVKLLKQFGDLIPDPMSERVNLDKYAKKWLKYSFFMTQSPTWPKMDLKNPSGKSLIQQYAL